MTISNHVAGVLFAVVLGGSATAQPPAAPQKRPRARPASTHIIVRDPSGTTLRGVKITVSGPGQHDATTNADGAADIALTDGTYRLRLEREGSITLEREVTIRTGRPAQIEIVLNAAPPPPPPPPPPPAPPPPPPPPSPVVAAGPPVNVSVPLFLEKNFIGRDPLKESILGCTPDATTRLLQLRDPLAAHTHANLDEVLYIVAGEGEVRISGESAPLSAGSLSVIPRGASHAIERRGRNPLIVLSMLAGAPCSHAPDTARR